MYKIEILMKSPEHKQYFWCILKYSALGNWCNSGHGWATSAEKAFLDANEYLKKIKETDIDEH